MIWKTFYIYVPLYEYVSCNQHGNRYKKIANKQLKKVRISTDGDSSVDLRTLILFSNQLDVPVRYNYEEQISYIELVSAEEVKQ